MISIGVVGSKGFEDWFRFQDEVDRIVDIFSSTDNINLVARGETGADALAERYAEETGLEIYMFPNTDIGAHSDVVVAFWDNKCKRTENTIKTALKKGKRVFTIYI